MSLVEGEENTRTICYQFPRRAIAEGILLLQGYETNGLGLGQHMYSSSVVRQFRYRVEGSLYRNNWGGWYVHLRGAAPFEYAGCTPISYSWTHNSDLRLPGLSGS
jgi:hypothetical protein